MSILNFQKPDEVVMLESDENVGKFEFRPLEPGYGLTVGNALRRVLLSSLEGFAITSVKIEGVDHEFSTIPGIVEDVTEIVLNLKQNFLFLTLQSYFLHHYHRGAYLLRRCYHLYMPSEAACDLPKS